MDLFFDDIVDGLVHQVQENVVPRLERATQQASQRLKEQQQRRCKQRLQQKRVSSDSSERPGSSSRIRIRPRQPPSNTDIVYLTDRFLISSQPAMATNPTFIDRGRDEYIVPSSFFDASKKKENNLTENDSTNETTKATQNSQNGDETPLVVSRPDLADSPENPELFVVADLTRSTPCTDRERNSNTDTAITKTNDATVTDETEDEILESFQDGDYSNTNLNSRNDDEEEFVHDHGNSLISLNEAAIMAQSDSITRPTSSNCTEKSLNGTPAAVSSHIPPVQGNSLENVEAPIAVENCSTPTNKIQKIPIDVCNSAENDTMVVIDKPISSPSGQRHHEEDLPHSDISRFRNTMSDHSDITPLSHFLSKKSRARQGVVLMGGDASHGNDENSATGRLSASTTTLSSSKDEISQNPRVTGSSQYDVTIKGKGFNQSSAKHTKRRPLPASPIKNSPGDMVSYLDQRHGRYHYLVFSLTNDPPDDRTLLLFRRQIVRLGWWSPCIERSETPSIRRLLEACYAIHTYLQLDPSNVVMMYCANGRTRTGIAAACYLKFAGLVRCTEDGFCYFLSKRGMITPPEKILQHIPPSLLLFFRQFDEVLETGGFLNRKPLLLKAIALQGVPVEDQPCIDIWDSTQEHVYSSHPRMWDEDVHLQDQISCFREKQSASQWVDEEGFYSVNVVLEGDFLILCRFGGDFAEETLTHDPSKILFRYTNTTGFISGGSPYELPARDIDLMRQYADYLDDEDFLVTLLFEADWEHSENSEDNGIPHPYVERLCTPCTSVDDRVLRCHDKEIYEAGLKIIREAHSVRPSSTEISFVKQFFKEQLAGKCPDHLLMLGLQLSNYEYKQIKPFLVRLSRLCWWNELNNMEHRAVTLGCEVETSKEDAAENVSHAIHESEKEICDVNVKAFKNVMNILERFGPSAILEIPDMRIVDRHHHLRSHNSLSSSSNTHHEKKISGSCSSMNENDVNSTGWLLPSIFYPHPGDVITSFGEPDKHSNQTDISQVDPTSSIQNSGEKPQIPFFIRGKPKIIPVATKRRRRRSLDGNQKVIFPIFYDHTLEAEFWVQSQLSHTGTTLDTLSALACHSRQWNGRPTSGKANTGKNTGVEQNGLTPGGSFGAEESSSMNKEAKGEKERNWNNAQKAQAEARQMAAPKTSSKEQTKEGNAAMEGLPLSDDPEFAKYFKMLKLGMSREQVLHAMKRDEKDPKILDFDPRKSLESQQKPSISSEDPVLLDEPDYKKYFKMLKMGMQREQVLHAMKRDEKDPKILDLDPNRSLKSQQDSLSVRADDPPLKYDPEYIKYFNMLAMKLPMDAVKNALVRDGRDPAIIDLDPDKSLKSQLDSANLTDDDLLLKEDPEYAKYFKMLAMKLPLGAVKNAMVRDGKDPSIMDLDPNRSVRSQLDGETEEKDTGTPLRDDPDYAKYFKMEKMGLPKDAVKNALVRDGKDPGIVDLDPTKSVAFQMKKKRAGSGPKKPMMKKKKVRRKKIYWNPIDPGKIKQDSMWNIVRDYIAMDKLKYDEKEFEELFTESTDPSDQKKKQKPQKGVKKLVQVIDPKRSMNGGIVLARMKTDHVKIAEYVNRMDHGKFDSTQLKALKEYLPDPDERRGLVTYMKSGEKSADKKEKLYSELSETEKYMVTLMEVPDAAAKLDAMLFRSVFSNRFEDITDSIRTLNSACDELRSSEKLRKLMAMILTVVNQINTGGEGKAAMGFTLDALLKLNEAKAFDRKTSVLHYVVKLVKKNDDSLLSFESDICHVIPAESVLLDAVTGDVKAIQDELRGVLDIVKVEAQRLEEAGQLRKMSLADLAEQKTMVQHVGSVTHFNKMAHLTGRTSMERFTLNAKIACDQAAESIDGVKKKYVMVLSYFGEDENMATGDFFGILRRFMAEWKKAVEQVDKIEKAEAKEKKRAAVKAAKEGKRGNAKSSRGSRDRVETKSNLSFGGVAAAAAQTASERSQRQESSGTGHSPAELAGGKVARQNDKIRDVRPTNGTIAALAAQAALKRFHEKTTTCMSESLSSGSSSLAAEKALKSGQGTSGGLFNEASSSGIPNMTAAAALEKVQTKGNKRGLNDQKDEIAVLNDNAVLKAETDSYVEHTKDIASTVAQAAKECLKGIGHEKLSDEATKASIRQTATQNAVTITQEESSDTSLVSPHGYEDHVEAEGSVGVEGICSESQISGTSSDLSLVLDRKSSLAFLCGENGPDPNHFKEASLFDIEQKCAASQKSLDSEAAYVEVGIASKSVSLDNAAIDEKRKASKEDTECTNGKGDSKFLSSLSAYRKNKAKSPTALSEKPHKLPGFHAGHEKSEDEKPPIIAEEPLNEASASKSPLPMSKTSRDFPGSLEPIETSPVPGVPFNGKSFESIQQSPCSSFDRGPPLGDFLGRERLHEYQNEVLRQNQDDTSAAVVAENLEMQPLGASGEETWDEGGGISDFLGWAILSIQTSDTESVRGFENSRNLDPNQDFDDESTIATHYDDDASIVSGVTPSRPLFDNSYFDEYHQATNGEESVTARVAASILFNDSETESDRENANLYRSSRSDIHNSPDSELIDMALSFNDMGLNTGLSFGADVGLDDGLGFGDVDDMGLSGLGGLSSAGQHTFDDTGINESNGQLAFSHVNNSNYGGSASPTGEGTDKKKVGSKWFAGWGKN